MEIDTFLGSFNLPMLTEEQNTNLMQEITAEELLNEIARLKTNKSAVTDGPKDEWYKKFKEQLTSLPAIQLFRVRRFSERGCYLTHSKGRKRPTRL